MVINRKAPEGNAFVIMGYVKRLLEDSGRGKDWDAARKRMESGDYENLCKVASEVTYGSITFTDEDE